MKAVFIILAAATIQVACSTRDVSRQITMEEWNARMGALYSGYFASFYPEMSREEFVASIAAHYEKEKSASRDVGVELREHEVSARAWRRFSGGRSFTPEQYSCFAGIIYDPNCNLRSAHGREVITTNDYDKFTSIMIDEASRGGMQWDRQAKFKGQRR